MKAKKVIIPEIPEIKDVPFELFETDSMVLNYKCEIVYIGKDGKKYGCNFPEKMIIPGYGEIKVVKLSAREKVLMAIAGSSTSLDKT